MANGVPSLAEKGDIVWKSFTIILEKKEKKNKLLAR